MRVQQLASLPACDIPQKDCKGLIFLHFGRLLHTFPTVFPFWPLVGLIYCGLFGFGVPKCPGPVSLW